MTLKTPKVCSKCSERHVKDVVLRSRCALLLSPDGLERRASLKKHWDKLTSRNHEYSRAERSASEAVKKLITEIMDFTNRSGSLAGAAKISDRTKRFDQAAPELLLATH